MTEATAIEWCDSTFNPWVGCTKISPACDHCYAEGWAKRSGQVRWGNQPRKRTSAQNWNEPRRWQRQAAQFIAEHGRRRRVFCASLADVFDNQVSVDWRDDLWTLISETPDIDWLLLTKRPQNIGKMLPAAWDGVKSHVWLGTTVEDQERAEQNIPHLLEHDAAVRFLSCEPLLGPIDLRPFGLAVHHHPDNRQSPQLQAVLRAARRALSGNIVDWVIAGGESGPGARPMHPDWARSLRNQCAAAGVPFLFKQWGAYHPQFPQYADEYGLADGNMACSGRDFPAEGVLYSDGYFFDGVTHQPHTGAGAYWVENVGKKIAGRLLDDIEHNGFPELP